MDPEGSAVSGFATPDQTASNGGRSHEVDPPPRDSHSVATGRHRAILWSLACSAVGVPLMSYLAFGLAKVSIQANDAPGPWWIWFTVIVAAVAAGMVASVFLGHWTLGRNLALVLMAPGVAMCLLLIWAFFFGLVFLPGALVWVPVLVVCQRMRANDRAVGESRGAA